MSYFILWRIYLLHWTHLLSVFVRNNNTPTKLLNIRAVLVSLIIQCNISFNMISVPFGVAVLRIG